MRALSALEHRRQPQGGFTLIELLVVIVILGLLAAIVVFATRGTGDRGREAAVQTDERTIRTALEVFCARNSRYPGGPGEPTPPQFRDKPMDELVAGKYLSNPSEYHTVATGDGDVNPRFGPGALADLDPEGKCTRTPKNFKLTCTNTPCGPGPGPIDPPPPQQPLDTVAAGFHHSLRLTSEGKVLASGSGGAGQLGDGTNTDRQRPVQVTGLEEVKAVKAGAYFSVALKDDGTVWAWGQNFDRQLGDGTGTNRPAPVRSGGESFGGVTAISTGTRHVLALRNGEVWAWGENSSGQVGNKSEGSSLTFESIPLPVKGENNSGNLNGVTAIAAGSGHSLAVKDGAVWAWGRNVEGQLGDGTTTDRPTPVQVKGSDGNPLGGVTAIGAGESHSVALKEDGTVWAWGRNSDGQLGDGTNIDRLTPAQVIGENGSGILDGVTAIASGRHYVLASKNGAVWAWGINQGVLGNDSLTPSTTPVRVKGYRGAGELTGATALAGSTFSMAAMGDGSVLYWGPNGFGQFGTGDWEGSLVPTDEADPAPPVNDAFAARAVLPVTGATITTGTNMFATDERENGEPDHKPGEDLSAGKSVWYQWTTPLTAVGTVTFYTTDPDTGAASNFNTTISAYTTNDPLNPPAVSALLLSEDLDRNDGVDAQGRATVPAEQGRVTVPATPGVVYFIAVDGGGDPAEGGIKVTSLISADPRRPCGRSAC